MSSCVVSYLEMNFANVSTEFLDENIPNHWLPNRQTWVCDFLCGFFKEKVYSHNIVTDDVLMKMIEEELLLITQKFFNYAYDSYLLCFHQCIANDKRHFNKFWCKQI